ncbi:MAG: hypothetical protein GXP62_21265 [Oligoflexia bacterium]|nr:hypothetical protein [Oligoflexia bacterium]
MPFVDPERVPQQLNQGAYKTSLNKTEPLCLVVNPKAGAGRVGARLDELKRAAQRAFAQWEIRLTEGPGHASELAAAAVADGAGIVAAVGGDGTCHEVAAGMVVNGRPRSNRCVFTTIPFGTGSDLVKTLKIPRRLAEAMWMVATGITLPTDVGRVVCGRTDAQPDGTANELFINVAGFGASGDVVRRANAMDKRMGGVATFLLASLATARRYRGGPVRLRWASDDGGVRTWEGPLFSCFVANGAFCGGGMWVGRGGTMQDGLFDVTVLSQSSVARRLTEVRRLYDGSVERSAGAFRVQTRWIEATAAASGFFPLDLGRGA